MEESEDEMSIASRTPSPPPQGRGDGMDIDKYDEYVGGVARETITVETKLKPTNKGFAMLAKLGWTEGQPLGISGEGALFTSNVSYCFASECLWTDGV